VQLAELITNPSATPKVPRGATSPNLSPVELRKSGESRLLIRWHSMQGYSSQAVREGRLVSVLERNNGDGMSKDSESRIDHD